MNSDKYNRATVAGVPLVLFRWLQEKPCQRTRTSFLDNESDNKATITKTRDLTIIQTRTHVVYLVFLVHTHVVGNERRLEPICLEISFDFSLFFLFLLPPFFATLASLVSYTRFLSPVDTDT